MAGEDQKRSQYGDQARTAYEAIRMEIVTQEVMPGTPITAAGYAEKLGMSRTPVREAIVRLAHENLVFIRPRKGAFVRTFSVDEIRHNYEIAEALEGMIVYLATPNINAETIRSMQKMTADMESASRKQDIESWVRSDETFHETLNSFCDNETLVKNRSAIQSQILRSRLLRTPSWEDKQKSNRDHQAILEAITRRDARAARDAMHAHWERIRKEFIRDSASMANAVRASVERLGQ